MIHFYVKNVVDLLVIKSQELEKKRKKKEKEKKITRIW